MSEIAKSSPSMSILSIGAVTPLGRDLKRIAEKLASPADVFPSAFRVNDDLLSDPTLDKRLRRADRFVRMAVIAAKDACSAAESTCADIPRERIGLIVATGFGPHCRGFRFIDGILDCGDSDALPTDFSHSVHGVAAAYITELLELRGPSVTATDFTCGFEQAVLLAQCWLDQGACDRVLVGAVEEVGEVLIHCASRMLKNDQRLTPGEGAVFFMLGPHDVAGIAHLQSASEPHDLDLVILDVPAIPAAQTTKPAARARRATTFNPYFGHSPSSSAFGLLGELLSLSAGRSLG
jgi:3-oxoacyl-[acyl-carrier-protein] synthase II